MVVFANISTDTDSHVIFIYTLSSKWLFSLEWYSYTINQHSIVGRRGKPICREEWSCCLTICLCLFGFFSCLEERNDWVNTVLNALKSQSDNNSRSRTSVTPEKSGYLELKGYKAKIFILLQGNTVWICKNEQVNFSYAFCE